MNDLPNCQVQSVHIFFLVSISIFITRKPNILIPDTKYTYLLYYEISLNRNRIANKITNSFGNIKNSYVTNIKWTSAISGAMQKKPKQNTYINIDRLDVQLMW